jgi:two-component system response regulator AtoC
MPLDIATSGQSEVLSDAYIIWGESRAVHSLNRLAVDLAGTNIPFLLAGETGTGKEVYAQAIHRLGTGDSANFWKICCASLSAGDLEHEIRRVSSSDRYSGKLATLFLDEVDTLSHDCQRILLSLDSNKSVGEQKQTFRLISSTTCDMDLEVERRNFRRELYFRLNGACLHLPPLRERMEDLATLLAYFLRRHAAELKRPAPELNRETLDVLLSYHWPGNIRELENVARKMVALGETALAIVDLRVARVPATQGETNLGRLSSLKVAAKAASRQTERGLILQALERTKWNRKRAARELQISYKSLLYKLKQIETLGTKSEK